MLKNYLTLAWRTLLRNKTYSLLNISGLTIGLSAGMLIILFVIQELSYDRFYPGPGKIYRATMDFQAAGKANTMAITPTPLGPALQENFPEVESYTRISRTWNPVLLESEGEKFFENNLLYADSGFFNTFGYKLTAGNPLTALQLPYSIVLTESMAVKYFGGENPVGKILRANAQDDYTVTGLMKDPPVHTHLQFDAIASFTTIYAQRGYENIERWTGNINYFTYFRLADGTDPVDFEQKTNRLVREKTDEAMQRMGGSMKVFIQPVTRIHLHSQYQFDLGQQGSIVYVYVFLAIAFLILSVAVINYTNLATAQSIKRLREVGMRKVMGAHRTQVVIQFLSESVLSTLIAFFLSVSLVEWFLPVFGNLLNRHIGMAPVSHPIIFAGFLGLAILIGLVSGFYPALYASGYEPARILKMEMFRHGNTRRFSNSLVVLQFFISIALVTSTWMINRQLKYITSRELGFDREQVMVIPLRNDELRKNYITLKERVENIPGVIKSSVSQNYLGKSFSFNSFREQSAPETEVHVVSTIDVDMDFFETYRMEIVKGRSFWSEGEQEAKSVVVNETLVRNMGWNEPLGRQLVYNGIEGYEVIGVVKDFHFSSLKNALEPVFISHRSNYYQYLNLRLEPGRIRETVKNIEELWTEIDQEYPLDYVFIDQSFSNLYDQEYRLAGIFVFFTLLAILSALLGLYSLVSYAAASRTREIGVRKVMGAGIPGILVLFTREFVVLVGISTLMAWPASYLFISNWLKEFAYQTSITPWPFIAGALLVAFLTTAVVVSRSFQAAMINPARSLRHE